MLVFFEVLLDRTMPNVSEEFRAVVQVRPEILECRTVAGTVQWPLPGVRETRTHPFTEELKSSTRLHLG